VLLLLAIVLATTAAGAWALADRLFTSKPSITAEANLNGLTATIAAAGWIGMDHHNMGGGFQMPAQMMPGAPEGDRMRLGIPITLHNTESTEQWFNLPEEFTVSGGVANDPEPLHSDTIGRLARLGPGAAVNGVLYFDLIVPGPDDPPLVLHWARNGDTVDMVIPMMGDAPDPHGH
jgi:hypothetical protein